MHKNKHVVKIPEIIHVYITINTDTNSNSLRYWQKIPQKQTVRQDHSPQSMCDIFDSKFLTSHFYHHSASQGCSMALDV